MSSIHAQVVSFAPASAVATILFRTKGVHLASTSVPRSSPITGQGTCLEHTIGLAARTDVRDQAGGVRGRGGS